VEKGSSRPKSYAYQEPPKALNSRIQSHAKYSNFNLHAWIGEKFNLKPGDRILDLGCGNGNYTDLFWRRVAPTGQIIGLDKNADLIAQAKSTHVRLPEDRVQFFTASFDNPFPPAVHQQFDWIFAIYSLYYAEDSNAILDQVQASLAPQGRFVVIGPGAKSGKKLNAVNLDVTGKSPSVKNQAAQERIEGEFAPLFRKRFGAENVTLQIIDTDMTFPTAEEFAEYYWSTLLWRESTEGGSPGQIEDQKRASVKAVEGEKPVVVDKQLACLTATGK
jgi:ubiquinone/menaquinone biosynthesis C-methylase UbiE